VCYHVKFVSSATKGVRTNRREPPKLGSVGTPPSWGGAWLIVETSPFPVCVTTSNLVVLGQRVYAYIERRPKIGERWDPALLEWGVADHLKEDPSPYVSPVKFGSSASKGVCINRSDPPKLGALGLRPCNSGVADSLEIHPSCRIWSFYVKRYECYLGDPPEKCDPHVPPFKVIGSDTYDFLLTFHSNHGPIS